MQFHEMVNEYLQRLNAFPLPGARVHVQRHAHGRAGAGHGIFKGLAAILKKGLRLNMVHDLNRPYAEMMLGLESWIPLYMTGQIAPWYEIEFVAVLEDRIVRRARLDGAAVQCGVFLLVVDIPLQSFTHSSEV